MLLSLLWPGLGQVYNGQVRKGTLLALLYAMSILLIIFASPLGFVMTAVLLVYGIVNAYRVAERYEHWIGGPAQAVISSPAGTGVTVGIDLTTQALFYASCISIQYCIH
jgi:TM2 domain-containing membrane protein YozV